MSFLFPTLLWIGLPLVLLPLVIHLLNPRRQRRVQWAAMQFLMESQRRSRNWILLRQFLLLLARTAIVALVALLLAGLVLQNSWARMFGTGETHHVVLVDDSYSMSDRWDEATAMDRARQVVRSIVDQAHQRDDIRRLTLLTFSEADALTAGAEPPHYRQPINDNLRSQLESTIGRLTVTESSIGLGAGLRGVGRLPQLAGSESQILHVVSDFRARHFDQATELRETMRELGEVFEHLHLIQCVRDQRPNLAITKLLPEAGLRAAGVEAWMQVAVTNFSTQRTDEVSVQLEQDGTTLPAIELPEIPPGEEVEHRFRVRFAGVGPHRIAATLDADAVEVDNRRYFACDLPAAVPVLLIDPSPGSRDAFYFATALSPGGPTQTGWQPRVEPPEFLRDVDDLGEYAAVILLDVDSLDAPVVSTLEEYVGQGGGLALFVGERTQRTFYNRHLYRDATGLLPLPLKLPTQLLDGHGEQVPDVQVTDSELFRALAGERNSFLPRLTVNYYYATEETWTPPADSGVEVLASLRNGAPLVVEQPFGKGRVVVHLTKLSPAETSLGSWSNWSVNPVFPVLANELCSHLAKGGQDTWLAEVGETLTVMADEATHLPQFRFLVPDRATGEREVPIDASASGNELTAHLEDTSASGVYEAHLPAVQGDDEVQLFAVNVDPAEGDLAVLSHAAMQRRLDGVRCQFHYADQMQDEERRLAGFRMAGPLLALILVLLIAEQLLGYSASYHAPVGRGGRP